MTPFIQQLKEFLLIQVIGQTIRQAVDTILPQLLHIRGFRGFQPGPLQQSMTSFWFIKDTMQIGT